MRESRSSGSVEGVMGDHDSYSDSLCVGSERDGADRQHRDPADVAADETRRGGSCRHRAVEAVPGQCCLWTRGEIQVRPFGRERGPATRARSCPSKPSRTCDPTSRPNRSLPSASISPSSPIPRPAIAWRRGTKRTSIRQKGPEFGFALDFVAACTAREAVDLELAERAQ